MKQTSFERWTSKKSAELYGIREWGADYFQISEKGELEIRLPIDGKDVMVSLKDIASGLKARGLKLPALLRFSDILDNRIENINKNFNKAIKEIGYKGQYRGVYPIKVNQQQQIVEEIADFGRQYHHGLEAGSKAELAIALAYANDPEAYVICNGYKDQEYIDLALYGKKIGVNTILVIEMPSELPIIIERAKQINSRPSLGLRVRLSTKANGHWVESGGDRSMFGLSTSQIIDVIEILSRNNMLDCLEMLHYHLGSQISNIRDIRHGIAEAARFYVELHKEGAKMGLLDIGGGLAVDYDGSHTNFPSSKNYSTEEYCFDIIEGVINICDEAGIPHPTIISESGRATVAYYSILLLNILDVSQFQSHTFLERINNNDHELSKKLMEIHDTLTSKNVQEWFHDAIFYKDKVLSEFLQGTISLRERAIAEQIFWRILFNIAKELHGRKYIPDELEGLEDALSDIYYGNFSVFQSLPDAWAIEQLFPVMPIHRLNEAPTKKAILADITCDCDGKIDKFIDLHDIKHSLPVHTIIPGEDYILGVFLVGAYQETLGDLHNLMGDTNVASIRFTKDGNIEYTREIPGDSVADVLAYVEYNPKEMMHKVRSKAEKAVQTGVITPEDRRKIMEIYDAGMRGYTYFEK